MKLNTHEWVPPQSLSTLTLAALVVACGGEGADFSGGEATSTPDSDYYPGQPTPAPGDDGLPEEEGDSYYRAAPAATDRFVYVVNPDRDTVSKINASTQAVYTLPVGLHPTQVTTGGSEPRIAAVLNEGAASLTLLNVSTDEAATVDIHPDTNYMAMSSDGHYVVTWYNPHVEGTDEGPGGVRSFSSISVVYTGAAGGQPTTTPMTVGLNPSQVAFISSRSEALVLCEDMVALVSLSSSPTARLIRLTDDPDENLSVSEMKVTASGRYAFLRLVGQPQLIVVDLSEGASDQAVSRVELPGVPTDMELTDDALILVNRGTRQLLVYDAQDPTAEPTTVDTPANQLVGSIAVAPEVGQAVLYTTLTEADLAGTAEAEIPLNRFSVWTLGTSNIRLFELVKPVKSVSLNRNPSVEVATFVHDGDAGSEQIAFDGEEAFSHYYFSDDLVVPSLLGAPIKSIADSPEGTHSFMILEESLDVVVTNYLTRQTSGVRVQSTPAFVGLLTGTDLGWVSQEHELGRISFVDPTSLAVTTITGFELNSQP